ncbi:hypothetical protein ACK355_04325, partial [Aeromonas veronii]
SGAVAQPTTSEMSRIQAACQGIRRVPSGGIGECRTSKLNSRSSLNYSDKSHLNEVGSYEYAKIYFNPIATIFKKKEMETELDLNVKTIKNI